MTVAPNNTILVVFTPGIINTSEVTGFFLDQLPYLSSSWSELHVGTGNTVLDPQVIEQDSGGITIADVNDAGGVDFYWSPANDIDSWYGETVSSTAGTTAYGGVSMADDEVAKETAIVAPLGSCAEGYVQDYGTSPWNAEQIGCPGDETNPEIAAVPSGGLVATDANNSGQGYFYWQAVGGGAWHAESLPGLTQDIGTGIAIGSYTP